MKKKTLYSQKSVFCEVDWTNFFSYKNEEPSSLKSIIHRGVNEVRNRPENYKKAKHLKSEENPYWVFDYEIKEDAGLSLKNISVKGTNNGEEKVFKTIEFGHIKIYHDNGDTRFFNFKEAFKHNESYFNPTCALMR